MTSFTKKNQLQKDSNSVFVSASFKSDIRKTNANDSYISDSIRSSENLSCTSYQLKSKIIHVHSEYHLSPKRTNLLQAFNYKGIKKVLEFGCGAGALTRFLAEQGTRDSFGHAQLGGAAPVVANMVKEALGYKFHWAVADYMQRAARHIASKTDVDQAYAMGKAAVEMAIEGKNSIMPAIIRTSNDPYTWEVGSGDLADIPMWKK